MVAHDQEQPGSVLTSQSVALQLSALNRTLKLRILRVTLKGFPHGELLTLLLSSAQSIRGTSLEIVGGSRNTNRDTHGINKKPAGGWF